ncbi:MAG: YggS family pyridoxal phosphate-dependent enzyme [Coriobacteriales bacterium]|nr:YggS family pyridoxal phosphate-dependent enzyme [Coriobacteriales bacterium]
MPSEAYLSFMQERSEKIFASVKEAAQQSGRDPQEITLCAVSKTVDVDAVIAALRVGYTDFGENRPQELERKLGLLAGYQEYEDAPRHIWHMIGNLQTNKINHVLACRPHLIHSIASFELARAVAQRASVQGIVQNVLLEVNVSGEVSKSGMTPREINELFDAFLELGSSLKVCGLMTMAPAGDALLAQKTFEGLRILRDKLAQEYHTNELVHLSMGMSEDYREAIAEGATIIRLGRIVFDDCFEFIR